MESNWQETTLRKGTKTPRICRDMFIAEYMGDCKLVIVKNGRIFSKEIITMIDAMRYQRRYKLKGVNDEMFRYAWTYRTVASNNLIADILNK